MRTHVSSQARINPARWSDWCPLAEIKTQLTRSAARDKRWESPVRLNLRINSTGEVSKLDLKNVRDAIACLDQAMLAVLQAP